MLEAGKKIGSYVLVRKLGAGGFGEVWQAEKQTKLSISNFALKFFRPKEEDRISLEKEKREIDIWQRVSGLPNVISIIEADEFEEYIYVVSEFADGGSLERQMMTADGRPFPMMQAVTIALEVLSGLNSLHQMSFVHRDVKPANILIRRGVYCLADFGISREMKAHSKSTQTAGTYEYMSPESFENRPVTIHSDIWAVGVIFQQLLTGSLPFPQKEIPSLIYSILNREPESMSQDIPAGLQAVVKKALEKDQQNRFSSAAEMISALKYQQMLLNKMDWNGASQQTLVLEDQAKTQWAPVPLVSTANAPSSHPTGDTPSMASAQTILSAQPVPGVQSVPSAPSVPVVLPEPAPKKSSRKGLILGLLGGGGLLILLLVAVAAAVVYKNTDFFTKNNNTPVVSNTNANTKSGNEAAENNRNTEQKAEAGTEGKSTPKVENPSIDGKPAGETPTPAPEVRPTAEATKRRETVTPATPKPTPVVRQQNTPRKETKKEDPNCIFNGDC